jgi:hypothetical protein
MPYSVLRSQPWNVDLEDKGLMMGLRGRVAGWATAVLIAIIEASSAVVLAWFGTHDIFDGPTFSVRLQAAMMIATAIILVAAAIGVLFFQGTGSHTAATLVIVGGGATCISGLVLLLYQLLSGDFTPWLWAWLAMTAGGAWVTIRVLRTGERLPYPKQFAFAVTITAILAAANFAYSSLYQPSMQPDQFALEVNFGKPAFNPKRTSASIPITITFNNTGKVGLYVFMATYSVVGRRGSVTMRDQTKPQQNLAVQNRQPASRHTLIRGYNLLQTDQFIPPSSWFQPGDRTDIGRTVDLPLPTRYDAIALNATVLVMRKDRASLNGDLAGTKYSWERVHGQHQENVPGWITSTNANLNPYVDTVRYQIPITESSYLHEQTRKDWAATTWWVLADPAPDYPAGPFLTWRMAPSTSELDAEPQEVLRDNVRAFERYGMSASDTGLYEVSVHSLGLSKPPAPER